ncbi:uncharacterized protein TNCT_727571 [Trichonephila clavata]|uniref:Uncharacterized protein n=1 Tax=Trichonephila clavata TaxID=2740835 RepID=A0A8X6HKU2_TRICU|nr:uncharacterized protein TNCT_727571 [Trichonephila clavata]
MSEYYTNFKIRPVMHFRRGLKYRRYDRPSKPYNYHTSIKDVVQKLNLDAEETKITRKSCIATSKKKPTMENASEVSKYKSFNIRLAAWLGLKIVIFITCITCFLYQSIQFYKQYSSYPTKTSTIITNLEMYTPPAITFCDRNPIFRTKFCAEYQDLCEKPNDLTKFCQFEPQFCKGNLSNLMIPKFGYFTRSKKEKIGNIIWQLLLNSSEDKSRLFQGKYFPNYQITFAYDQESKSVVKCLSSNLHISSKSETKIKFFRLSNGEKKSVYEVRLSPEYEELFFPWLAHQVFFAIHSPFVSINPFKDGRAMKPGYVYNINIRVEEEHLLPHPYQTNCTDYEAMWKKNNRTGPRSQQMCREMCQKNYSNLCYGCEKTLTMFENIEKMCSPLKKQHCQYEYKMILWKIREECRKKCKVECLRLKYPSTIEERAYESYPSDDLDQSDRKSHLIDDSIFYRREYTIVAVYIRDSEMTIISHDPLYSAGDLFSHIGGLIGCWLGISVWALTNIMEGTVLMAANWMKKFEKKKQKISDIVFYPTDIKPYQK